MPIMKMRSSLLLLLTAASLMPFTTAAAADAAAPAMPSYCEKDTYPAPDVAAIYDGFMQAIAKDDAASVNAALTAHHVNVNARYLTDGFCYLPLVAAIERYKNYPTNPAQGGLQVVDLLLDHGANPNVFNYDGLTPLQYAVKVHSPELAQALLAHGADVDVLSHAQPGQTALHQAMSELRYDPAIVTLLLKAGASARDINLVDVSRYTFPQSLEIVKLMIVHGADVNAQWHGAYTVLEFAAEVGNVDLTRLLLDNGAAVDTGQSGGEKQTPLDTVAEQFGKLYSQNIRNAEIGRPVDHDLMDRYITIAGLLLAHGADANAKDALQKTPLHYSVASDDPRIASALIAAGADVNALDYTHRAPLDYAETAPLVTLLLSHGAKLDREGRSALRNVMWQDRPDLAALFIANGADVNAADDRGTTALHIAAYKGDKESAEILLSKGAKVDALSNAPGTNGTPLQVALSNGNIDVAKVLIDRGADYKSLLGNMSESDIQSLLGPQRAAEYEQSKKAQGKPPTD